MSDPIRARLRGVLALLVAALLGATVLGPVAPASAVEAVPARQLTKGGFGAGDKNSYSWSMAWFKGRLYVGTGRSQLCVEAATYDFYFPGQGYNPEPAPDLHCPPDRYDLDLRAQIWQYTPKTNAWKMVYQAPADIPNPRAPGKFVARDIGYRGMVVHTDTNGKQALYIGGVTADEYIPEIAVKHPPRLLKTTDGKHFTSLGGPGLINDAFGQQRAMGFRALTSYRGRLLVTATGGLTGDGVVMEVSHPNRKKPTFVQLSPSSMQVFDMKNFAGKVYVGAGSGDDGYSVWRTTLKGRSPTFVPVVTAGAGRGGLVDSVVSMQTFQGRLYVGASGWAQLFPSSELIRIARDDSWELVVGNPRLADGEARWPVSGLTDGFGNVFNSHFWRMSEDHGALYLGTNDWSWAFRNFPLIDAFLRAGYGFDLYSTCNGSTWSAETTNAFGDGLYNFGVRTLASNRRGFVLGSTNHAEGTATWAITRSRCDATTIDRRVTGPAKPPLPTSGAETLASPARANAQVARCGTAVSWRPVAGASRYTVSRSVPVSVAGARLVAPRRLPNGFRLSTPPKAEAARGAGGELAGPSVDLGTVSSTSFIDRTSVAGSRPIYAIRAVDGPTRGRTTLVGITPRTTMTETRQRVAALATLGQISRSDERHVSAALEEVGRAPDGARAQALRRLDAVTAASGPPAAGVDDLRTAVDRLAATVAAGRAC